jgi:hypothetical protein
MYIISKQVTNIDIIIIYIHILCQSRVYMEHISSLVMNLVRTK